MTIIQNISINIDPTNPGHFFACCGLLELFNRLWPGAEGYFNSELFTLEIPTEQNELFSKFLEKLRMAPLITDKDNVDLKICPFRLGDPFNIRLDWWLDEETGGNELKTWAGQQRVIDIAKAMKIALIDCPKHSDILNYQTIVKDIEKKKAVDPFYFDPRRFVHALHTGFSTDTLGMDVPAFPAVEFFTLIGLQRFRPVPDSRRTFRYTIWSVPLNTIIAPAALHGIIPGGETYRFRLLSRDAQDRYKGFDFARKLGG
ncbi:MAG: hypothetical protein QW379_01855 [Thermoplasmata archaeon]